jgi:hypothetical protein
MSVALTLHTTNDFNWVMAKVLFCHSLSVFILQTEYFETREKLKVALITFKVSKTETRKQIIFWNWLIRNEYSYKWDWTMWKFSKILKISRSTSFLLYLFATTQILFNLFIVYDKLQSKSWTIYPFNFVQLQKNPGK